MNAVHNLMRVKGRAKLIRELYIDLRYVQNINRLDASSLRKGREKAKRIGAQLRALRKVTTW